MVIYFSWSGNTKAYAEELANRLGLTTFRLEEKTKRKGKISFIKGCFQGVLKKEIPVIEMPDISNYSELFICTPIWSTGPAPAIRYFLNKANIKNVKIHFIFTYGGMTEPAIFKKSTLELLRNKGCIIGEMHAFTATFKQQPDAKIIKENINEVIKHQSLC